MTLSLAALVRRITSASTAKTAPLRDVALALDADTEEWHRRREACG
jgi:hypothetical protein